MVDMVLTAAKVICIAKAALRFNERLWVSEFECANFWKHFAQHSTVYVERRDCGAGVSVVEQKFITYSCDYCRCKIPEGDVFRKFEYTAWTDRDVHARMVVMLDLSISYHSGSIDICRKCALLALKKAVAGLEGVKP